MAGLRFAHTRRCEKQLGAHILQTVMRPLSQLRIVSPDTPALAALELMTREDLNQLPMVSDGHIAGVFSRAQVLRYLQLHSDLMRKAA
jgi:CBS domain-containing protein